MPTYFSTRLTDRPQFPSEEKSPRRQKEEQYSDCIVGCDHPESGRITEKLGYDTTQQYPYAKAEIPGSKDGGIGSASLVMTGCSYEHVQESWIHVTIAQTDQTGGEIIAGLVRAGHKRRYPARAIHIP